MNPSSLVVSVLRQWWCTALLGFALGACGPQEASVQSPELLVGEDEDELYFAPNADRTGSYAVGTGEYRLPAMVDPDVLGDRATEVWARVWWPTNASSARPLLLFLHGNHGTCGRGQEPRSDDNTQYTSSGTCPVGYVVTPNHLGYAYLAERLASWGYVVVSVNANRGITAGWGTSGDSGLNLARGRLVLKHLQLLSEWNASSGLTPASVGQDLAGRLDFSAVGLLGHSRGGEGVRAAYNLYRDPGSPWPAKIKQRLDVRGVFEIGPVDGQTSRVLDAPSTSWAVLLPMCDGDVSDLQGMKPFDRMLAANDEQRPTPKAMFAVWGANHNYYNSEWQVSDARSCYQQTPLFETGAGVSGSANQRLTGSGAILAFFRAFVRQSTYVSTYGRNFDPQYALPTGLSSITRIERSFVPAASPDLSLVLEDFSKGAAGLAGVPVVAEGLTAEYRGVSEHAQAVRAATLSWTRAADTTHLSVFWAAAGQGTDLGTKDTFDFRISRVNSPQLNKLPTTSFSVALVHADGTLTSAVKLKDYIELAGPGGHTILQSVRIPLRDFTGLTRSSVRGARFTFDDTASGSVHLTGLRASKGAAPAIRAPPPLPPSPGPAAPPVPLVHLAGNAVVALRPTPSPTLPLNDLEVELDAPEAFFVSNELPVLRIGAVEVVQARYPDSGDTHRLIFRLTPEQVALIENGDETTVSYGTGAPRVKWVFGGFDKSRIR